MNTTEYFKRTIQAYLEERAMEDELFAAKYDNPDKNIDDCVTYILNWVQKSGCNGFCDDEIYGQAIHYYEEKDIEVGKPLNCQVSVNQPHRTHRGGEGTGKTGSHPPISARADEQDA